jgi:hypothetical protein
MPRKIAAGKSIQFSITLPAQTVALLMRLRKDGYFPQSRGEIARDLILAQLRHLGAPAIADALRTKSKKRRR